MIQMNIFTKQKQTYRLRDQIWLPGGRTTGRDRLEAGINKLESRLWGQIAITSDMQMTPPLWQRVKNN